MESCKQFSKQMTTLTKGFSYIALILCFLAMATISNSQTYLNNSLRNNAICITSNQGYSYLSTNLFSWAEIGPSYGCLLSQQKNPAWFYFYAIASGDIHIQISSNPCYDVDFICWGPLNSFDEGCNDGLTSDKILDCSFDLQCHESCDIQVEQGKCYFLLITNFSNLPCTISFSQSSGSGSMYCDLSPLASNNGPICSSQDIHLNCATVEGASYLWSGPSGFTSSLQNPVISSATIADSGFYTVSISIGDSLLYSISTHVDVFESSIPQVNAPEPVCYGESTILTSIGSDFCNWYQHPIGGAILSTSLTYTTAMLFQSDTIWVSNSGICDTVRIPVPINVTTTHIAQNDTIISGDETLTLNIIGATAGNCTYLWSTGDTTSTITITPIHSSVYTVTIYDGNMYCTDHINIIVQPRVCAPDINTCAGEVIVPVRVFNLYDIAAISLCLTYNNTILTFSGIQNTTSFFSDMVYTQWGESIQFWWYSIFPVQVDSAVLFEIRFQGIPGNSSLTWNTSVPGYCELDDLSGNIVSTSWVSGNVVLDSCSTLEGTINYMNVSMSPMPNSIAYLYLNNVTVYKDSTDYEGQYEIENVASGNYFSGAATSLPWGGGNSADALIMIKHYAEVLNLSGLKLIAADCDGSGYVNATDALLVSKRFVGLVDTFSVGDWIFENDSLTILDKSHNFHNIGALCYGDVDGSYLLSSKIQPEISLRQHGTISANDQSAICIPIRVENCLEIGSFSLVINLADNNIIVQQINCKDNHNLVYHQEGKLLKVAWFNLEPLRLLAGDVLFSITIETDHHQATKINNWSFESISQVTNSYAIPFENVTFNIPEITIERKSAEMYQNIPNPCHSSTTISFYIPGQSSVQVAIFNMLGQTVFISDKQEFEAGLQTFRLNFNLNPGAYFYQLKITSKQNNCILNKSMIVN